VSQQQGSKHCPGLEKMNSFLVEQSASWHVSLEECRRVGWPAS